MTFIEQPWVKRIGIFASIVAFAYFLMMLSQSLSSVDVVKLLTNGWFVLLIALVLYLLAFVPQISITKTLLDLFGAKRKFFTIANIVLLSQIGKYLPGNVGQFVGRFYLSKRHDIPVRTSMKVQILELALTVVAAVIVSTLLLLLGGVSISYVVGQLPLSLETVLIPILVLLLVFIAFFLFKSYISHLLLVKTELVKLFGLNVLILLLLACGSVVLIYFQLGDMTAKLAASVFAATVLGWFLGFITPGAPGGLGMRELVFVILLQGVVPMQIILLTAAAMRIISIVGDGIAFCLALMLSNRVVAPQNKNLAT